MIVGKLKMGRRFPGMIVRTQPQVFIQPVWFDHFARVHLPFRVPSILELAKGLDQLRTKHFRQQLSAGLSISVLPGK